MYLCFTWLLGQIQFQRQDNASHERLCWINVRKKEKRWHKVCEFCGKTFGQKYNRDRHVKTQHEDKTFSDIVDESDNDAAIPTFVPQADLQPENQNQIIDLSDQETRIYKVHGPPLNIRLSPIRETDASTAHNETTNEVHGPPLNIPRSTIQQNDASATHNETSFSIGIELAKINGWRTWPYLRK